MHAAPPYPTSPRRPLRADPLLSAFAGRWDKFKTAGCPTPVDVFADDDRLTVCLNEQIPPASQDQEHTDDRLLSCGRPCPGIDLQVTDDSGKQVEVGKPGELVARGANIMRGYWNNPGETALAFRDGSFRTGDIGYQDSEGYFYILDRAKDMIVTGGENVYSGEVEAVIYAHPAVREAAVFGIPNPKWGELVMACVVLKPGSTLTVDDLIAFCRRSLASYKIPRRVEFSETELPKSGSGKILKRVLRERFWAHETRAVS
ncbi:MAG: AMP-binding protein [Candidatus Acidiferrales bacterium]